MNEITKWTLLIHVGATLAMVGLIWFVQIVHYPLFDRVGEAQFQRYETDHQRLTSWVVIPLMLAELVTAIMLFFYRPPGVGAVTVTIGAVLVFSIWLITFSVQVPQHGSLAESFDAKVHARLVAGNWLRTVAWNGRGLLVLSMVAQTFSCLARDQIDAAG